ncbi:MFS transporter [Photobacterium kasasachensis]|uniref:MFS transporter n=1 Tax=Photobacterium kasasachensis TaxID=2910240 RepID=UPI003D0DEC48
MDDHRTTQSRVLRLALLINMLSIGTLMMVMPLGADFVKYLNMKPEHIGYIAGGATFASALIGFFLAPYLDRFDRKKALLFFLLTRSVIVIVCGLSTTQNELLLWFVLAGCFAGPISGLTMASVIDITDIKSRGKAIAFVASGFSLAAIIFVPASLELSARLSWQATFFVFGGLGVALALACNVWFPSMVSHLDSAQSQALSQPPGAGHMQDMVTSPAFMIALGMVGISMFGHFLLVPNLSIFFQFNLEFPREQISVLYLLGGVASIFAMRLCGQLLDRGWIVQTIWGTSLLVAMVTFVGFLWQGAWPLYVVFTLFMASSSARSASVSAITSRVPKPHQRAAFMSYQGTLSNVAAGLASAVSSVYLTSGPDGRLVGIETLAMITIGCTLLVPLLVRAIVAQYTQREQLSAHTS